MASGNHFLDHLDRADYAILAPHLRRVTLKRSQTLAKVGEPIAQLVLPIDSIVSVLVEMEDGEMIETRTIGRESGFGLLHAIGGPRSCETVITQVGGDAYVIDRRWVAARANESASLRHVIVRHSQATLVQTQQSVACNAMHDVRERLCRWLLITQDRLQSPELPLKQEHLACMLGVQRTTVTAAASQLQREGAIRYRRGMVTVCDREQLLAGACECYRAVEERACWFLAEAPQAYFGAGA